MTADNKTSFFCASFGVTEQIIIQFSFNGGFVVPMQKCCSSMVIYYYSDYIYTSVDGQRRMIYNDLKCVNVSNKIEVYTA